MINVPIRSVFNGEFYHTDGYKYKMGSTHNTRIECHMSTAIAIFGTLLFVSIIIKVIKQR